MNPQYRKYSSRLKSREQFHLNSLLSESGSVIVNTYLFFSSVRIIDFRFMKGLIFVKLVSYKGIIKVLFSFLKKAWAPCLRSAPPFPPGLRVTSGVWGGPSWDQVNGPTRRPYRVRALMYLPDPGGAGWRTGLPGSGGCWSHFTNQIHIYTCTSIYVCIDTCGYTPYEGLNLANLNNQKLEVFGRKLEETSQKIV